MKQAAYEDNWILNAETILKFDYNKNEDLVEKLRSIYGNHIETANKELETYIDECNCKIRNKDN